MPRRGNLPKTDQRFHWLQPNTTGFSRINEKQRGSGAIKESTASIPALWPVPQAGCAMCWKAPVLFKVVICQALQSAVEQRSRHDVTAAVEVQAQ